MSEWKKVKLVDICDIRSGKRLPKGTDFSTVPTNYKYIRARDIKNGIINGENLAYITKDVKDKISKYIVNANDIAITIVGASVGDVAYVSPEFDGINLTENAVRLTNFKDNTNPRFIFYILNSPEYYLLMQQIAGGAAQPKMGIYKVEAIEVCIPSIFDQNRIVDILSRYDSLIENYQKQIKLLEEAAQRLYKEWFVDLHFPGHENTKIVDGVPEGWEKKTVESLLDQHMNGGWGKDSSTGSNVIEAPVIRGTDIEKIKGGVFKELPVRYHTEKDITNKHLEANDIILELSNGNIDNVGRTLRIDDSIIKQCGKKLICASFCKFLRPIDYCSSIILTLEFQDMQNGGRMKKYKKNGANGINNFDFQGFLKHELLFPSSFLSIKEMDIILKCISKYRVQISFLTEARDRLLPKLMSGEIAV